MIFKKGQTSTEYVVIIAIVIVVALVVVQTMGGFPGLGGGASKKVSDYKLASSDKVGIEKYAFYNGGVVVVLKNNNYDLLKVENFTIAGIACTAANTNNVLSIIFDAGQKYTINCTGPFVESQNDGATPSFIVTYSDMATGASYTSSPTGDLDIGPSPFVCSTATEFHSGTGTIDDPFTICCWAHLNNVKNRLNSNFVLLDSLNSTTTGYSGVGDNWNPIGNTSFQFTGNFNGNSYIISDLVVNKPAQNKIGFFGYSMGNISKLGLVDVDITGASYVGALAGHQQGGVISYSYTTGVVSGVSYVGGFVGYLDGGQIFDSYSTVIVNGGSS